MRNAKTGSTKAIHTCAVLICRRIGDCRTAAWKDKNQGLVKAKPERFGDVVLARKDVPTSYHLAVTVDDHLQEITMVNRGDDRPVYRRAPIAAGPTGYTPPGYDHHRLIRDPTAAGWQSAIRT